VYKPYGENIYRYDVNSLYPYVMNNSAMPVGSPVYFEGEITKVENKPYGIFEYGVVAPDNINEPVIKKHVKSSNGMRTIAPLGKWTGTYFSEEIYNAINYGYKFKIIKGSLFDQANIFEEYVTNLYEIKQSHSKDDPMYLISKLLLNSLYGRFYMSDILFYHNIIDNNELYDYIENYSINEIIPLDTSE
jgi:hypothetical protein